MSKLKLSLKDPFTLPANVLLFLGLVDLLRGFMHTFNLTWSATNIAKLNLTTAPMDQLFLLGVFGISNWLTGFIYILISRKARELSPFILALIPAAYLLGLIGIWSGGINGQADFEGRYFMLVYFTVCVGTVIAYLIQRKKI